MDIFYVTKGFLKSEQFVWTSQMVRSSRAVCSAITVVYRKRQYEKHFKSKLSDADSENSETKLWYDFALACNYIDESKREELQQKSEQIGRLLNYMINNPDKFGLK